MKAKLLLSTQRSGSHFVKSFIETHFPSVECSSEILREPNPDIHEAPALESRPEAPAFWAWYETEAAAGRISVSPGKRLTAFATYLTQLVAIGAPKDLVIDVKYNSIRSLSGFWDCEYGSSDFTSFLTSQEIPVLHLIRRNSLRTLISNKLATQTGIWFRTEDRSRSEVLPRLRLNPKDVINCIRYQERVTQDYKNQFHGSADYEEVFYEDLVEEQYAPEPGQNVRAISRFLAKPLIGPIQAPLRYKKTTPEDPSEVVENWNEVLRALQTTEYGWMAQNPFLAAA